MSKIITSFLFVVLVMTSFNYAYCSDDSNTALFFPLEEGATLTVNGDELVPKFSTENKDYFATSISAITPNIMKFGNTTKTFSVKEISPASPTISFQVGSDTYNLHIWEDVLSEFDVTTSQPVQKGHYFVTQEGGGAYHAAYMLDGAGKILYYYSAPEMDKDKILKAKSLISDFKFFKDTDGKIYYSLWVKGAVRLMDENFQPIDTLHFFTASGRKIPVERHHHKVLSPKHHILQYYYSKEVVIPETNETVYLLLPALQEVKDDELLLSWDAIDYPQYFPKSQQQCFRENQRCDFMHLNSFAIDPKDGNIILSFRALDSLVKIDRKTGNIIFNLGGNFDEFGLDEDEIFYAQHFPTFTKDGYLMIFDNHVNINSRKNKTLTLEERMANKDKRRRKKKRTRTAIKKFKLDEENKRVLDFKMIELPFVAYSMGSVSETQEGNYLVSPGSAGYACALEVDENGDILWQLNLKDRSSKCFYAYKNSLDD